DQANAFLTQFNVLDVQLNVVRRVEFNAAPKPGESEVEDELVSPPKPMVGVRPCGGIRNASHGSIQGEKCGTVACENPIVHDQRVGCLGRCHAQLSPLTFGASVDLAKRRPNVGQTVAIPLATRE